MRAIAATGQTLQDQTVTIRGRDTLNQKRIPSKDVAEVIKARLRG
jgi:glycyl-tRNA synthetase